jgi:plasmid stabilization system protein ParE
MINRLYVREEAEDEIDQAYSWYEEQQAGLGEKFLSELGDAFSRIVEFPESFPVKSRNTRECFVGRFPYIVTYRYKKREIIVYAVFHASRNPKKKRRK